MEINDGKGIFDKYGMLNEIRKKLDLAADARGAIRCGLLWDISCMLAALQDGLKKEDGANVQKIETLKAQIQAMEEVKKDEPSISKPFSG